MWESCEQRRKIGRQTLLDSFQNFGISGNAVFLLEQGGERMETISACVLDYKAAMLLEGFNP